jgi:hypothetical protein
MDIKIGDQSWRTVHLMEDDVEEQALEAEAWLVAFLVEVSVELVQGGIIVVLYS